MTDDLVEVDAVLVPEKETTAAYCVDPGFVDLKGEPTGKLVWLPKSKCKLEGRTVYCPEWLAIRENLV